MKTILVLFLMIASVSTFANVARPSTEAEVKMFCKAIDKALVEEMADMAIDVDACAKVKMKTIGHYVHGTVIRGKVTFNTPNGSRPMNCQGIIKAAKISSKTVTCQ